MTEPNVDTLRPAPAIAPPPVRPRTSSDLWRLLPYIFPYRVRWIAMVTVAVLSLAATVSIPLMTKAVIDGPVRHQDQRGLWILGLAAMAIGISEAVLRFLRRWLIARGTMGVEADIRTELYAKLQRLPMAFHGRWQSGQLLSRIMNDLATIRRFIGFGLIFIVMNVVQIGVTAAILLQMYWPLGLVVIASIVPVAVLCLRNEREYTRLSRQIQDQTGDVASTVEEGAYGLRVIKAFGRSRHMFGQFDRRSVLLYDTSIERGALVSRFWTFLEVIPSMTLIVVLGLGAVAAGQGQLTLGTLVAFITLLLSLVWPVAALGFLLAMTQEAMTAATGSRRSSTRRTTSPTVELTLDQVVGRVRFTGAAFRFADSDTDVHCTTSSWRSPRARRWRWSARPDRARPC